MKTEIKGKLNKKNETEKSLMLAKKYGRTSEKKGNSELILLKKCCFLNVLRNLSEKQHGRTGKDARVGGLCMSIPSQGFWSQIVNEKANYISR